MQKLFSSSSSDSVFSYSASSSSSTSDDDDCVVEMRRVVAPQLPRHRHTYLTSDRQPLLSPPTAVRHPQFRHTLGSGSSSGVKGAQGVSVCWSLAAFLRRRSRLATSIKCSSFCNASGLLVKIALSGTLAQFLEDGRSDARVACPRFLSERRGTDCTVIVPVLMPSRSLCAWSICLSLIVALVDCDGTHDCH